MDYPVRVLQAITGMGSGGAESMLMNWYRHIDHAKVQFDFLLRSKDNIFADEIAQLGGKVFYMPEYPAHYLKNRIETLKFLKSHSEYRIIHVHGNALIYTNILGMAKKLGIPSRIMHSHSTQTKRMIYRIVHLIHKPHIKRLATDYLACSQVAGKWMFTNGYRVINNGVDVDKFRFQPDTRGRVRHELALDEAVVIGHIGRFLPVKNHVFLLDVFEKVLIVQPSAVLLLIGSGVLEIEIRRIVKDKGMESHVRFLGVRKDIPDLLQAMDAFLFPSIYEGFPISLIEAQAAGLPCFVSENITSEVGITDLIHFLPLQSGAENWANELMKSLTLLSRRNTGEAICQAGYDVSCIGKEIEAFYLECANRGKRLCQKYL